MAEVAGSDQVGALGTSAERLALRRLGVRFGSTTALDAIDLSVKAGEIHAIVGENGAGKSTLMKVLSGAVQPDCGTLYLDGQRYRPFSPRDARRRGVSMIYQELSLLPHLTAEENLLLDINEGPDAGFFLRRRRARRLAEGVLEQLNLRGIPLDEPVRNLPVASRQIIEIVRALVVPSKNQLLILDEPTSSLSRQEVMNLFRLLNRLKHQGCSILYISHFLEEIMELADRFSVLRNGRWVGTHEVSSVSPLALAQMMTGCELGELYPRSKRTAGPPILELKNFTTPGQLRVPHFELRRGEVVGIAGLMGSGRTELLRAIFGLDAFKGGLIRVGSSLGRGSPARRWRQGVGFVSEDRRHEGLSLNLSIADNLTLPSPETLGPWGWINPRRQQRQTEAWIERLSIRCKGSLQNVTELSGGNQQKVALARLLNKNCDLFLLDEPTRGIDIGAKAQIYELINQLAGEGKAVLIVSSYLPELLGLCDRIAVMRRKKLGPARPVKELNENHLTVEMATVCEGGDGGADGTDLGKKNGA
ncbi:MAG: sugar ABC transporter [Bdellovibrio sp.]|nr:MAG: sugar ABC transporter [Bdellovibrio sp.]